MKINLQQFDMLERLTFLYMELSVECSRDKDFNNGLAKLGIFKEPIDSSISKLFDVTIGLPEKKDKHEK